MWLLRYAKYQRMYFGKICRMHVLLLFIMGPFVYVSFILVYFVLQDYNGGGEPFPV